MYAPTIPPHGACAAAFETVQLSSTGVRPLRPTSMPIVINIPAHTRVRQMPMACRGIVNLRRLKRGESPRHNPCYPTLDTASHPSPCVLSGECRSSVFAGTVSDKTGTG